MLEASKQLLHGAPGRIRCARRTSLLPQATWAHAASLHHRLAARGHLEHTPIELQPTLYMRPLFYCFILSTVTSQPNTMGFAVPFPEAGARMPLRLETTAEFDIT